MSFKCFFLSVFLCLFLLVWCVCLSDLSDLSFCLIGLFVWFFFLSVFSFCPICLFVWFVFLSDLSNLSDLSVCPICLFTWILFLSDMSDLSARLFVRIICRLPISYNFIDILYLRQNFKVWIVKYVTKDFKLRLICCAVWLS